MITTAIVREMFKKSNTNHDMTPEDASRLPPTSSAVANSAFKSMAPRQVSQAQSLVNDGCILHVVVKQAMHIGSTNSPDAYVRLYLGPADTSECDLKSSTRAVFRNRCPCFEETFTFPLRGQALESSYFTCVLMDYDPLKDKFLGQLQWRLSTLLAAIPTPGASMTERFPLTDRSGEELMPGELELQWTMMAPTANIETIVSGKELYAHTTLQNRFGSRNLQISMHGIHGLRTVASAEDVSRTLKDLGIEVRVGTVVVREDISAEQLVVVHPHTQQSTMTLKFHKKVVVPLSTAFVLPPLLEQLAAIGGLPMTHMRRKTVQELGDVRIYLMNGSVSICKAQFPLWALLEELDQSATTQQEAPAGSEPPDAAPAGPGRAGRMRRNSTPGHIFGFAIKAVSSGPDLQTTSEPFMHSKPEQDLILPMERYGKGLVHPVELECTAEFVSATAEPPSHVIHSMDDDDVEDVASAPPMDPALIPTPLPTMLLNDEFACGPSRLYAILISPHSPLMKHIWELEGLTEVVVPDWSGEGQRTRTITYIRKLSIPMGPKSCNVRESQKLVAKEPGGWVLEIEISTTAPKGDLFVVKQQVVVQKTSSPTTSNIRVSMMVDWVKSGGMLKSIIENSATRDSKTHWGLIADDIRAFGTTGARAAEPATPEEIVDRADKSRTGSQGMHLPGSLGLPPWLHGGVVRVLGPNPVPGLMCVCCMLLVVLLLLWRHNGALQSHADQVAQQLRDLQASQNQALESMSSALKMCMAPQGGAGQAGAQALPVPMPQGEL